MNLTQYALMTCRTAGTGVSVADYFERCARSGEEWPSGIREARRVQEFCSRVCAAVSHIRPGDEGAALWGEADELAAAMRGFIEACKDKRGSFEDVGFHGDGARAAQDAEHEAQNRRQHDDHR